MKKLFAGIDLGTSGCRLMIIDEDKKLHHSNTMSYSNPDEQSPKLWWQTVQALLKNLAPEIKSNLQSIAVDGTSGTVLLVDDSGNPITRALMYHDLRATEEAKIIKEILPANNGGQGASGSLARVLWLLKHHKIQIIEKGGGWSNKIHISHQADYILGKLSNNYAVSDENNCLKLGYDVINQCWPNEFEEIAIPRSLLPKVYPAGTSVATISPQLSEDLRLPESLQLVTGTTDSIAAFISTGATKIGDAVTSLGSTLVLKLISDNPIFSSEHGVYSHRLQDKWLVGGASNSGAKVLQHYFTQNQIDEMTSQLSPDKPTNLNYYPLVKKGERFPVADTNKLAMLLPRPESDQKFFHGILEGIADIEVQGYQKLIELGAPKITSIRSVGGGSKNTAWTKIRKNIFGNNQLKIDIMTPMQTDAAYGSALLAMKGYSKNDQ